MQPIPVHLVGETPAWPAIVQAFGSILAILASVGAGLFLQDRGRQKSHDYEVKLQRDAVAEIASRCVCSLKRLDRRARANNIGKSDIYWLTDELTADVATVDAIDLMTLKSSAIVLLVTRLQRAVRQASRRLGYIAQRVHNGEGFDHKAFEPALNESLAVLNEVRGV